MIHTAADLLTLARTYCEATGMSLSTLGVRAVGNDKTFSGLAKGKSCLLATAEVAGMWFSLYWPHQTEWPERIFRPHVSAPWRQRLIDEEARREAARNRRTPRVAEPYANSRSH
jgi:hypothetical protein